MISKKKEEPLPGKLSPHSLFFVKTCCDPQTKAAARNAAPKPHAFVQDICVPEKESHREER